MNIHLDEEFQMNNQMMDELMNLNVLRVTNFSTFQFGSQDNSLENNIPEETDTEVPCYVEPSKLTVLQPMDFNVPELPSEICNSELSSYSDQIPTMENYQLQNGELEGIINSGIPYYSPISTQVNSFQSNPILKTRLETEKNCLVNECDLEFSSNGQCDLIRKQEIDFLHKDQSESFINGYSDSFCDHTTESFVNGQCEPMFNDQSESSSFDLSEFLYTNHSESLVNDQAESSSNYPSNSVCVGEFQKFDNILSDSLTNEKFESFNIHHTNESAISDPFSICNGETSTKCLEFHSTDLFCSINESKDIYDTLQNMMNDESGNSEVRTGSASSQNNSQNGIFESDISDSSCWTEETSEDISASEIATDVSSQASALSKEDMLEIKIKEWMKQIRISKNARPRHPKVWEYLARLLNDPFANPSMIKFEDEKNGVFRLINKELIASIWGKRPCNKKKKCPMTYDSMARNIRYHYKRGNMESVSEKQLVYKLSKKVLNLYKNNLI